MLYALVLIVLGLPPYQRSLGIRRHGEWRQKDQELKVIFGYIMSLRSAWVT